MMANWVTRWRAGGRRARLLAQLAEELIQRGGDAGVGGAADADDLGWHALAPRADGAIVSLDIELGIPLDACEPLEGAVSSRAARAIAGAAIPFAFRVPAVPFRFRGQRSLRS